METDVGLALQDEELWTLLGLEDAQLCTFFEDLDAAIESEGWSGDWRSYHNGNVDVEIIPAMAGQPSQ
eukprot:4457172-Pyramimonas_sp.AAC.1